MPAICIPIACAVVDVSGMQMGAPESPSAPMFVPKRSPNQSNLPRSSVDALLELRLPGDTGNSVGCMLNVNQSSRGLLTSSGEASRARGPSP